MLVDKDIFIGSSLVEVLGSIGSVYSLLIHFPLILSLILQSKLSIESSKGIYSIYLFSFPFLIINIITNDFPTTNQLNKYIKYINLGDPIAVLGSIDSVLGSVDLYINSCL